ncbi:MAG TPA: hypothetical protein VMF67_04890 [Rhizomicrobium sp.]|nr:hypothetical protein [Rhizomicrobium sp.]
MAESGASGPFKPGEDFYELPPDDPHYTRVGRVASAWARFEYEIDSVIWTYACREDERGACLTAQYIGPGPRFKALIALVRLEDGVSEESVNALCKLAEESGQIASRRNRIVHDSWMWGSESYQVGRFEVTADKRLRFGMQAYSIEYLEDVLGQIAEIRKRFREIWIRIGDESYEAWRKKQP